MSGESELVNTYLPIVDIYLPILYTAQAWLWSCNIWMSNLRESCSRAASIYKIMLHGLYGYINVRRSELVKSLVLYTIEEKRDFFLATLMSIRGIALAYLCNQIVMTIDVNGYDTCTRVTRVANIYLPKSTKDIYKIFYCINEAKCGLSSRCCKRFPQCRSIWMPL